MDSIHDILPSEVIGRETILRFHKQFQAAAYAALEILSGKGVDRVYCDYHDDFVVRRTVGSIVEYHFFQVKTKGKSNQQWTVDEIYSLKKSGTIDSDEKLTAIRHSIAGKLFIHTIKFGELCREVTILSNVHFQDDVYDVANHLKAGKSDTKYISRFIAKFSQIFSPDKQISPDELLILVSKFSLMPNVQYIDDTLEAFSDAARNAIWKHSEIDLHRHEVDVIAENLFQLVISKSCAPIKGLSKGDLDHVTGVSLEDLLSILSISTEVYQTLLNGEDPAAIKTASVLQRQLKSIGASEKMIETASRAKVLWDEWLRNARHTFPDFELTILLDEIDNKCTAWLLSGGKFTDLKVVIDSIINSDFLKIFSSLNSDLIFGGFCSSVVRRALR